MKKLLLFAAGSVLALSASAQIVIAPPTVADAQAAGYEALWGSYDFGYVLPQGTVLAENDAIKVTMNNGSESKPGANVSTTSLNTDKFTSAFNMGSAAGFGAADPYYALAAVSDGIKQPYAIFEVEAKIGGELKMYTNRGKNKYTIYVWDTTINEGVGTYVLASSTQTGDYGKEFVSEEIVSLTAEHKYWVFASEVGANTFMYQMEYVPFSAENYSISSFDASKYETVIAPPAVADAQAAGYEALWGSYDFGYVLPQNTVLAENDAVKVTMNNGSESKPGANVSTTSLNTTVFPSAFNMGSAAGFGAADPYYALAAVSDGIKQPYAIFEVEAKIGGELSMFTNRGKNKYTIYVWDTTINEGVGAYVLASSTQTGDYGKEMITESKVGLTAEHKYWVFASEVGANTLMYAMCYNSFASPNYGYQGTSAINEVIVDQPKDDIIYNIMGQRVDENYKGLVIKNGKKFIQ